MSTPVERPSMPSPVAVVATIIAVVIGLLILKSAVGFVFTLVRLGVIAAFLVGVLWVGLKIFNGPPDDTP